MGVKCLVPGCGHYSDIDKCRYFSIPSDDYNFNCWKQLLNLSDVKQKTNPRVCSCHFKFNKKPVHLTASDLQPTKLLCTKKNKLEETIKPRGFERGLTLDKIVGVTNCKNELSFLLKWHDCSEYDLVKAVEVNEKCPEVVIEYYESRCPLSQKCVAHEKSDGIYESDLIENPAPIREKIAESEDAPPKTTSSGTDISSEPIEETTEELPFLKSPEKATTDGSACESDVVNAAFSINVDDTNSVQVSYSLPIIENQPGDELLETQIGSEQSTHDISNCHMPQLQDVEMQ